MAFRIILYFIAYHSAIHCISPYKNYAVFDHITEEAISDWRTCHSELIKLTSFCAIHHDSPISVQLFVFLGNSLELSVQLHRVGQKWPLIER